MTTVWKAKVLRADKDSLLTFLGQLMQEFYQGKRPSGFRFIEAVNPECEDFVCKIFLESFGVN